MRFNAARHTARRHADTHAARTARELTAAYARRPLVIEALNADDRANFNRPEEVAAATGASVEEVRRVRGELEQAWLRQMSAEEARHATRSD